MSLFLSHYRDNRFGEYRGQMLVTTKARFDALFPDLPKAAHALLKLPSDPLNP